MARVRDIELNEAPKEISLIYKKFIESYLKTVLKKK